MNSHGLSALTCLSPPWPALNHWAPISFWLHSEAFQPSPGVHLPCQPGICWYASFALGEALGLPCASTRSLKLSASGQMPESMTPMMMLSPACAKPPSWSQRPPGAVSPRNVGVDEVSE